VCYYSDVAVMAMGAVVVVKVEVMKFGASML
jgi:hypothetical protein